MFIWYDLLRCCCYNSLHEIHRFSAFLTFTLLCFWYLLLLSSMICSSWILFKDVKGFFRKSFVSIRRFSGKSRALPFLTFILYYRRLPFFFFTWNHRCHITFRLLGFSPQDNILKNRFPFSWNFFFFVPTICVSSFFEFKHQDTNFLIFFYIEPFILFRNFFF